MDCTWCSHMIIHNYVIHKIHFDVNFNATELVGIAISFCVHISYTTTSWICKTRHCQVYSIFIPCFYVSNFILSLSAQFNNSEDRVSPGYMVEQKFYDEVMKNKYLLYQYPTAFLMAKEVTLEFSGLDASTKSTALSTSVGVAAKGSYGPITFGGSTSMSGSHSSMRASSTANGLKVEIPGAQLIGYYCDIVPKFPNNCWSRPIHFPI